MSILSRVDELIQNSANGDIHYKKWNVDFRDQYFKDVYWSYFPITEKYFFEGNPTFLYEYRNFNDLARYPLIIVRDGFAGILDFFLNHPIPPEDFRTILLIPKKIQVNILKDILRNQNTKIGSIVIILIIQYMMLLGYLCQII